MSILQTTKWVLSDLAIQQWLPHLFLNKMKTMGVRTRSDRPIHIMLCIADHFEPFHGGVSLEQATDRVSTWITQYPRLAARHHDADGKPPQHTWFYPPHLDHRFLKDLVALCASGFGEIEMHLHHNRMKPFPDTSETLRDKILQCIRDYSIFGIFCLPDGSHRFGFVHGDWSLDNARGNAICGVNDEITILKECGCYADFTFPSLGKPQPATINKIYYVKDDPDRPKSYNYGKELKAGGAPWGDLLMIQGIIGLRWKKNQGCKKIALEVSDLDGDKAPSHERIDYWINHAITIPGRPEWKFLKLHVHGAPENSWKSILLDDAHRMYQYLETKYNDQENYILHYVTAREMYNILKAAEAGKHGNPNDYRNYELPRYVYLR